MARSTSPFHAQTIEHIFAQFQTSEAGLEPQQVEQALLKFGKNTLPKVPPKPAWQRFLQQFHNLLIYVLLASALVSFALQHWVDGGVILGVVVINALVGFVQEGKAEQALKSILSMSQTQSLVLRQGSLKSLDSQELVPGDLVYLQAGDRVPADLRLYFSKDTHSDESALTGESSPVSKHTQALAVETPLAERNNMAYMGSLITHGVAHGIVIATGQTTQIGEINGLVNQVHLTHTPLQRQLIEFAKQLTFSILVLASLVMLFGSLVQGFSWAVMFQAAIGISVAAIPEGLPAIVTITLAIGVQRMAEKRALVRRLPSVEVLGSVDVICSDKTGTLTANAMTVREIFTADQTYRVTGEGYTPTGAIISQQTGETVLPEHRASLNQLSLIALLCNDAQLRHNNNQWQMLGDPTEGALLSLAQKHGLVEAEEQALWPRIDEIPFSSDQRYMATLHHNVTGETQLLIKGAPDKLFHYAQYQMSANGPQPFDLSQWQTAVKHLSQQGMRVLVLAYKPFKHPPSPLSEKEIESGLILVGLVAISDPPRPEAITSIQDCHQAGIRVKMITGDSPITAAAIGQELGLHGNKVLTGQDIDQLDDLALAQAVQQTDIFARTSPAHKLRLVSALQDHQHVVAMTGDGVNDAPALKKADLGIAMGGKGTDAAKEAADFVLTDDNFSTISRAIAQGRTVYDNIVKAIVFILPTNMAQALVIVGAIVLSSQMPITPAQILWVNMVTAITLALALAFEQTEPQIMQRPPRPYHQGLFNAALIWRIIWVGSFAAIIVSSLFHFYLQQGATLETARSIAINSLVLLEAWYLLSCRFLRQSIWRSTYFHGSLPVVLAIISVILLQLGFTYWPVSQQIFGTASLSLNDWLIMLLVTFPVLLLVEFEKWLTQERTRTNKR